MYDILTGEFFWGIIVGIVLSAFGGWLQAKFSEDRQQKIQKKTVRDFCIDTVRNLQNIIRELDKTRDRAKAIHHDFLNLVDVEIGIYGRNREHMLKLPEAQRTAVREFMTDCALKKAEVASKLEQFYQLRRLADQALEEGRTPEGEKIMANSLQPLGEAQRAADKLVALATEATDLLNELSKIK